VARGKAKKPSDPKCRGCNSLLEGRSTLKIGGNNWHYECAVKAGKKIPKEYQEQENK
jgi:hypothetical protein